MSSQSKMTHRIIDFIDDFNPKPPIIHLGIMIKMGCIYVFNYLYSLWVQKRPDKVNCMGFTLSTTVAHVRPLLETIAKAPKFLSWLKGIKKSNVRVESIEIMDADFFGPSNDPTRLGFLKIKCCAFSPDNQPVDGIVLIRGPCAVVCAIIEDEFENEFILTVEQFRMPMRKRVEEFLAGMCDEVEVENPRTGKTTSRNSPALNAVLIKELKEEAGLVLKPNDPNLHYLGDIMLSPGLLDEKAKMFAWYTKMENAKIEEMLAKEHGELGTNEKIRLHLYPIEEFHKELHRIGDAKTEVAFIRMLNKDDVDPDENLSDEDYVYESDEDDDESDEDDDESDEDDDESDEESVSETSDEDDDDSYMPELIDEPEEKYEPEQTDNACESDHEDMRNEYVNEQQEEYMQKWQEEQQLYVFVPDEDKDGEDFDESLQVCKSSKPNSPLHNVVVDLTLD